MCNKIPLLVTSICALILCTSRLVRSQTASADDACVAIARIGLMDTQYTKEFRHKLYRFFSRARSDQSLDHEQTKKLAADATIPYEGVMIGMGFESNESGFKRMRSAQESELRELINVVSEHANYKHTANKNVADLVSQCLDRSGVVAFASYPEGGAKTPVLKLEYRASAGGGKANLEVDYGLGIECKRQGKIQYKVELVHRQKLPLICSRTGAETEFSVITLTSTDAEIRTGEELWLSPVKPPAPAVECEAEIPNSPITVAGSKFAGTRYTVGPYCTATKVTVHGSAEAQQTTNGSDPSSEVRIHKGVPATLLCSDLKGTNRSSWTTVSALCPTITLPAKQTGSFMIDVNDRLTDTKVVVMRIKVESGNPASSN